MQTINLNFTRGELLLIDKPLGWTSFDVVNLLRRFIRTKIGHAGTLDPLATGLLIIATGKATKNLAQFTALDKHYIGTMTLGATTPSYDKETTIDQIFDYSHVTPSLLRETTQLLTGQIEQLPPLYSAVKVKGKKLYEYALHNEYVPRPVRKVYIYDFQITNIHLPEADFAVHCSKGTYIRSLVHDFGKALGCGAYLSALRRTRIGNFQIEHAWNLDTFVQLLKENKSL